MEYSRRTDVPDKYKWDLSFMYKSESEYDKDLEELNKNIEKLKEQKDKFLNDADSFYNTLTLYFDISRKLDNLLIYASVKLDVELSDNENMIRYENIMNVLNKFRISSNYIDTNLIKLDENTLKKFYKENDKLKSYKNYIDRTIKIKEHMLSESEENIISMLSKNYSKFEELTDNLLDSTSKYGYIEIDGKKEELTTGNYRKFLMNKDRNIRKQAFEQMNSKLFEYRDIYASALIGYLDTYNKISDIRGYKNVLDFETFAEQIPTEVHDKVTEVCMNNLDSYRRYFKLIKKYSGLDELHSYDLYVPITHSDKVYSIEEARYIIIKSLSVLGNDYLSKLNKIFDEKRIDYAPYKGKKSGAYSISSYDLGPLVLTNYNNKFSDISILAHELGHSVHSLFSCESNPFVDSQYEIFVAEVASLTNEILLSDYIVRNSDSNEEKLVCIYNMLDIIENNFFDAIIEGKFEDIVHERIQNNIPLTADSFDEIIKSLRNKFYGDTVIMDQYLESRWARRVHYYYPFYLYKYATGVSAAIYFATNILNGNEKIKKQYIEFLKMGGKYYPNEELLKSGVDLTSEDIYLSTVNYFNELIDKFEEIKEVK